MHSASHVTLLFCHVTPASAEAVAAAKAAQNEMYQALLSRRQTQLADFEKKAARYKDLLVKEMVSEWREMKTIIAVLLVLETL